METNDRFQARAATEWYKPCILRVPGLLLGFAISLSLIGLLEYAVRTLPSLSSTEKGSHIPKVSPGLLNLNGRQTASASTSSSIQPSIATDTGAYVQATGVSTLTMSMATKTTIGLSTGPNAYVQTTDVSTLTKSMAATTTIAMPTTASDAYVQTTGVSMILTTSVAATTIVVIASNPSAYVQTTDLPASTLGATATTILGITSNLSAYVQTTDLSTSTQGVATTSTVNDTVTTVSPTASPSPGAYVQTKAPSSGATGDTVILSWPLWKVFVGGYLPVLLAILFKVFWTSIYANIKLIEPFIQLARPTGALAKDAFGNFYLSSNLTPGLVISLFKDRWLMCWTSIVYQIVGFLPPLASESLFRDTRYNCPNPDPNQPENPCWPRLSVNPIISHLLQGLLSFVVVMTLTIMYMVTRSPSGIASDPSTIAFVASMIHHPDVLKDFRQSSNKTTDKDILSFLGRKSYRLGNYVEGDGVARYGIISCNPITLLDDNIEMIHSSNEKNADRTGTFKLFLDVIFMLFILGLLGVILAYYKDGANDGFNRFFNNNSFGPRFFMSAMGTIISMNLKRLEREVQTLSPFYRLARAPSPAGPTILLRKFNVPFSAFIMLLVKGHIFGASMAFVGFLSEILVVVLAAIPYSPGEIFLELILCTYISIGILSVMLLVLISLVFWKRHLPYLPRPPDTLGGVISYLCNSRMIDNFDGCTGVGNGELEKRISRLGKKYNHGEYMGVDGQVRWMIEESTDWSFGEK